MCQGAIVAALTGGLALIESSTAGDGPTPRHGYRGQASEMRENRG
jgi:hypothetical protein